MVGDVTAVRVKLEHQVGQRIQRCPQSAIRGKPFRMPTIQQVEKECAGERDEGQPPNQRHTEEPSRSRRALTYPLAESIAPVEEASCP